MKAVTYAQFRRDLARIMDQAADDHDPVIVTRSKGEAMVLLSLEDFEAYRTTLHLMGTPEKRAALEEAMAELERGEGIVFHSMEELSAEIERRTMAVKDAAE